MSGAVPAVTPLTTADGAPVVVRRSARRRRTVAAFWEDGTAVVAIPASFSRAQEREWVHRMLEKLRLQGARGARGSPTPPRRPGKREVGVAGFEPATSCSQSRHSNQAELHPEGSRSVVG